MSAPLRQVVDNCIFSPSFPPAQVKVDAAFRYVGSQQFVLKAIAYAEQHIFVVANATNDVQRLVWIQFEGFLPDNDKTYNYSTGEVLMLGSYRFVHHSGVYAVESLLEQDPTSDTAQMMQLLGAQGYRREGGVVIHRYVYVDPTKRHELMIIYSEALAPTGFQVADLGVGGSAEAQWPGLERETHVRALASLTISPTD